MPIPSEVWKESGPLLADASKLCPGKEKRVRVKLGTKHKDKIGIIFWHGEDRFNPPGRYAGNALQEAMTKAVGIRGYHVGVRTDDGEKFFVPAEYVEIIGEERTEGKEGV